MKSSKLIIKNNAQKVMTKSGLDVDFMILNILKVDCLSYALNLK